MSADEVDALTHAVEELTKSGNHAPAVVEVLAGLLSRVEPPTPPVVEVDPRTFPQRLQDAHDNTAALLAQLRSTEGVLTEAR